MQPHHSPHHSHDTSPPVDHSRPASSDGELSPDAPYSANEEHPFIEPRLDYDRPSKSGGLGALFNRRTMALVSSLLVVVLLSGFGISALLNSTTEKASTRVSDSGDTQAIYDGDGSDITARTDPFTEWTCPDGAIERGEDSAKMCEITKNDTQPAKKLVSCSAGYTKVNDACEKRTGAFSTETVAATRSYSCASGYTRTDTTCRKTVTVSSYTVYTCPSGYALVGTGSSRTCQKSSTAYATPRSSCPSGFTKVGTGADAKCRRVIAATKKDGKYVCPRGYTLVQTSKCKRVIGASLSCPSGYTKSGSGTSTRCFKQVVSNVTPTATKKCSSGYSYTSGTCKRTLSASAKVSYSCASGYQLNGSNCLRYSGGSVDRVAAKISYSCPKDFKRTDKTCKKSEQIKEKAELVYRCQDGWELLAVNNATRECVKTDGETTTQ